MLNNTPTVCCRLWIGGTGHTIGSQWCTHPGACTLEHTASKLCFWFRCVEPVLSCMAACTATVYISEVTLGCSNSCLSALNVLMPECHSILKIVNLSPCQKPTKDFEASALRDTYKKDCKSVVCLRLMHAVKIWVFSSELCGRRCHGFLVPFKSVKCKQ